MNKGYEECKNMASSYTRTTWYADNTPYRQDILISLSHPDWCEFEKRPFYPALMEFLDEIETPDIPRHMLAEESIEGTGE